MTGRNRKRNGADQFEMAREALAGALDELAKKRLRNAISRAYYAAFHTATAVLMTRGIQVKKHKELLNSFSREFVKTGVLEGRYKDILDELFAKRGIADYGKRQDWIQITEGVAASLVSDAETFARDLEAWTRAEWEKMGDE